MTPPTLEPLIALAAIKVEPLIKSGFPDWQLPTRVVHFNHMATGSSRLHTEFTQNATVPLGPHCMLSPLGVQWLSPLLPFAFPAQLHPLACPGASPLSLSTSGFGPLLTKDMDSSPFRGIR